MKILVTGGAGYVGSHAARTLARRGHRVVLYDNLSTGHAALAQGFPLIRAELADVALLRQALDGVDLVMHFAAHAYVGESVLNPRKYFQNNVQDALVMLNTVLDCGIRSFVFSSTCATYGIPAQIPISEDAPQNPVNPYGDTKLFFERALNAYSAYGLRSVLLRYFNAAGADESSQLGELHEPETHLIPLALDVAAGRRDHLDVFGNDYPTPDGTCIRDYIHVNDLAEAHLLAAEHLSSGGSSLALNLGTGQGHSVKEVISTVERLTGKAVRHEIKPRRPGDPPTLVADPGRAQKLLRWKATRSFDDIIRSGWSWTTRSAAKQ
ncbi:MAG: UDP-glucose 4-epimerase GalE [Acidobacteriia bacterium]|nr:UDP-glucose 4-epimerase GalE [Terriglobia bacterium]